MMVSEVKKRVVVSLTIDQTKELEEASKNSGLSKSAIISLALKEWMKKNG